MEKIFLSVLNMSLTGAFVIAAICLARLPLKKAPKIISYALWAVAGFRLVFPFSIQSMFSLLPFKSALIPPDIAIQTAPRIDSGINLVDNAVSAVLPPAVPAASVNPLQIWITAGTYIWLFGGVILLIYSVVSIILLKRRLRGKTLTEGNLYEADNLKTPFVIGLFRPKIYIPADLSGEERRYIVLHEQTHILRHDHAVKMFAYLVLCLHWFNPLAWIAFILMGADMEMSCDERVIKELGGDIKKAYSLSLVRVAAGRKILNGSPLAFGEGGMKERIKNILNFKKRSRIMIIAAVTLAAVLIAGLVGNREVKDAPGQSAVAPETESPRTYGLENPTERQKFERLKSVMLYSDGRVKFMATPISSYMIPDCYSTIVNDELLIHAIIPIDFEEGAFGVKNGDVIARFTIADEHTLVFQSATVPLFADKGARYVCSQPSMSADLPRKWLDYYFDEQMPWDKSFEMELPEYPGVTFRWTSEKITAIAAGSEKVLIWGMPVWNVYLADLTGDGLPEFCATVSVGSGIVDERILVCDYATGKTYEIIDRMCYDYVLFLDNGRLMVKQTKYPGPKGEVLATGELAIVDGKLVAIGIDRKIQNQLSYKEQKQPVHLENFVVAENTAVLSKGENVSIRLVMTAGDYFDMEYAGAGGGIYPENYQGNYEIQILNSEGKILSTTPFENEGQPANFSGGFDLLFDDYNKDGNPDFSIGQWGSSNLNYYELYTIMPESTVKKLNIPAFAHSSHEFSVRFEKDTDSGFYARFYNNAIGETVTTHYVWDKDKDSFTKVSSVHEDI